MPRAPRRTFMLVPLLLANLFLVEAQRAVKMDKEAHTTAREWMQQFDGDKDGFLSFDELGFLIASNSDGPGGGVDAADSSTRTLMERVDANSDATCSMLELLQFSSAVPDGTDEGAEVPRLVAKLRRRASPTAFGDQALDAQIAKAVAFQDRVVADLVTAVRRASIDTRRGSVEASRKNMVKKSLKSATLSAASWERALATSRAVAQVRTSVDCARSSMDMSRISSFFSSAPVARV